MRKLLNVFAVLGGIGLASWLALPIAAQPQATPVSQSGTWNIATLTTVSSLPLPSGAATEASLGGVLTSVQSSTTALQSLDDLVLLEDAVHGSGAAGVQMLAVRNDAGTAFAADGDYVPLSVDSSGAVRVTGGGGGTQYTEGDTDATITGTALLWEGGGNTLTTVAAGTPLPVTCATCSGTGVQHIDDAAFTVATDDGVPIFGMFDDVSPDSVNEGDGGAIRMSANRNLYVTFRDAAGNERGANVTASNELLVTGAVTNAGTFAVQITGAALTALQLIDDIVTTEDTASAGGASGAVVFARRTDTPANQSTTDGDYEFLQISAGRLWTSTTVTGTVTIDSELPAASALADNTSNPTTPSVAAFMMCYDGSTWDRCTQSAMTEATQDGALTVASVVGNIAMARASSTEPTNVGANDDAVMLWALPSGALATTLRDSTGDDVTDTTNDAIRVNIVAGAAAGGTSMTDDGAFTVASSALTPVGGTYRASRDSVNDGDGGAFAMTITRALYISPETPNGDSMADDTNDALKVVNATAANLNATVVGTGTFAVQVSSLPASTNTIEVVGDAAHDATIAGNPLSIGGVSSAAAPTDVSADGEAVRLWALRNGALAIQPTFSGTLAAVNNGAASAGVLRVTVANDSTGVLASVGAISTSVTPGTSAAHLGKAEDAAEGSGDTGVAVWSVRRDTPAASAAASDYSTINTDASGLLWAREWDPCTALARTTVAVSVAADTAVISAGGGSTRTYICGGGLVASAAEVVSIWEGTGTACGTGSAALAGSTTEANGMSLAANGGFTIPTTIRGLSTNVDVCIRLSATNRVAGWLSYVQVAQ